VAEIYIHWVSILITPYGMDDRGLKSW